MLSLEEVRSMYGDNKLDKDGLELLAQHHEERRKEKIRVLLEVRVDKVLSYKRLGKEPDH